MIDWFGIFEKIVFVMNSVEEIMIVFSFIDSVDMFFC